MKKLDVVLFSTYNCEVPFDENMFFCSPVLLDESMKMLKLFYHSKKLYVELNICFGTLLM
jgi:hypothetical protein